MATIKFKTKISGSTQQSSHTSIPELTTFSSAIAVASNNDLLTEILRRLPIKSLLQFKTVSKHWLSHIKNPRFSLLRSPAPIPASALFLHRTSRLINPEFKFVPLDNDKSRISPTFTTLTFVNDPSGIEILQSCNGLLCCRSFRGHERKRNYYVYNPTTKQFTTLPRPGSGVSTTIHGMNLAFDPYKSPNYKVVCVRSSELTPNHCQIEIYSSDTGPWKVSGRPFFADVSTQFRDGVYWNGAIHWISIWGNILIYFNVVEERLETMQMPPIPNDRRCSYFGESLDHLHLVEIYGVPTTKCNVYEMERDYSGWDVKYRVDLESVFNSFPEMIQSYFEPTDLDYYAVMILSIVRGEREEDSFMVLEIPGKAIRYNFLYKSFKKLCDFAPRRLDVEVAASEGSLRFGSAFQYIESLSCV